eukprot:460103_1
MSILVLCCLLVSLSYIRSASSVETQYFIAVNASQYQDQNQTITCPENMTCDISCAPSYSCATLIVNAANAINLHITCDGAFSCSSMDLTGPNSTISQLSISCTGESSCDQSTFRLPNANNIQIHCVNRSACRFTTFFVHNTHNVSVHLNGAYASGQHATIYANGLDGMMNVYCTGNMACNHFNIETERMLGDLNIFCSGSNDNMCNGINVNGADMLGNLNFECNTSVWKGCGHANIFCPLDDNANCSIYCSGREGHECQFAKIYVGHPSYVNSGHLQLTCEGETSCAFSDIRCFYDPGHLCSSGCDDQTGLRYNYYDHIWSCDDYECGCPWPNTNHSFCNDAIGADCDINCVNQTHNGCENMVIDASLSNNLYLNCERNSAVYHDGCEGSTIICPQDVDHAKCVVTCGSHSCQMTTVIAPNGNNAELYMKCVDDYSCQYTNVIAMNASDLDVHLKCEAEYSCASMNANLSNVDLMHVNCSAERSCESMRVNIFSGPNQMDFYCGSTNNVSWSCVQAVVKTYEVPTNSTWNQYCLNTGSCRWMYLDVLSPMESHLQLSLHCLNEYSCADMVFAAPNGAHASIYCTDIFSCGMGSVEPYRMGWDLSNFSLVDMVCDSSNSATQNYESACTRMMLTNVNTITVYCNAYDCAGLIFAMENAGDIYFDCDGDQACYNAIFRAGLSHSLTIDCNGAESCRAASIDCPFYSTNTCDLMCSGDADSCAEIEVFVEDEYVYEYFNLQCNTSDSCTDINFHCAGPRKDTQYCPLFNGECNIYCSDTRSCVNTFIHYFNNDIYYSDHNITLQCNNASHACLNTKVYAHRAGNIYFESITTNSSDVTIYGSYAKSITISCIVDFGCSNLDVYGENVNDFVNVFCYGRFACDSSNFYFESAHDIHVIVAG